MTPLRVVDSDDANFFDARVQRERGFNDFGPHIFATGDNEVAAATLHAQSAIGKPVPQIVGVQKPATVDWRVTIAIRAQHHRTAQQDLAIACDFDLDTIERNAVVHNATAGFGETIGGHGVRRTRIGWWSAAQHDAPKDRWVNARKRGGDQRSERGTAGRCLGDGIGIEARQHGERGAAVQRSGDHRQAAYVREGKTGEPMVVVGDAETLARCIGRCRNSVVREHHTLGFAGGSAGGNNQCVAGFNRT